MLDRGRIAQQGLAAALVCAWLFLALSLLGYVPSDPPSGSLWLATPQAPRNPCGPVGAWAAHLAFSSFGWAVVLILPALAVCALLILRRRRVSDLGLRLAGALFVLAVTAACLAGADHWLGRLAIERSPTVGSGAMSGRSWWRFSGTSSGRSGRC